MLQSSRKSPLSPSNVLRNCYIVVKGPRRCQRLREKVFSTAPSSRRENYNIFLTSPCNEPWPEDQTCICKHMLTRGEGCWNSTCRQDQPRADIERPIDQGEEGNAFRHQDNHRKGHPSMPWLWLIDFLLMINQEDSWSERTASVSSQIPEWGICQVTWRSVNDHWR